MKVYYDEVLDSHATIKEDSRTGDQLPWITPEIKRPFQLYRAFRENLRP